MTPPPPGPELDRLVAEKVMGWTPYPNDPGFWQTGEGAVFIDDPALTKRCGGWSPSTSITHAWRVLEAIQLKFREGIASVSTEVTRSAAGNPDYRYQVCIIERVYEPSGWAACDGKYTTFAHAKTAPHAICLAALASVEKEATR